MATNGRFYQEIVGRIQFGPIYRCWVCGTEARGLYTYHDLVPPPTALDTYARHLAYLNLPPPCKGHQHPARVVRIGPAITPVDWPEGCELSFRLTAIDAGIQDVAEALAERRRRGELPGSFDDADRLSLQLYSRAITPVEGAEEIRALAL